MLKPQAARMALAVILVTGAPPAEKLKWQPWLQIDAVLLKPFTIEELLITVKKVLCRDTRGSIRLQSFANLQSQQSRDCLVQQ